MVLSTTEMQESKMSVPNGSTDVSGTGIHHGGVRPHPVMTLRSRIYWTISVVISAAVFALPFLNLFKVHP
jgi:hypothetical protein